MHVDEVGDMGNEPTSLSTLAQGAWFGFRSAAAGGRLLQARRRGCSRLAFFSAGFGVWEQWELVAGDPAAEPWACLPLGFRSRCLPQVRCKRPPVPCANNSLPVDALHLPWLCLSSLLEPGCAKRGMHASADTDADTCGMHRSSC